jgi:ubiquinone biosynthesis protein
MASRFASFLRLAKAGFVLAQHGVRFVPKGMKAPFALHLARWATLPVRALTWPFRIGRAKETRVARALGSLGPSYIKLGQFLATRADLIGPDLARDLAHLQDRMPPFPIDEARSAIESAFGRTTTQIYGSFGPAIAAASIAQVHKATVPTSDGAMRDVAVKVLRPGVERRFARDLDSYRLAAGIIERWHPPARRLKPLAVVENLERTTELEMDLRLEAAAISEMADNIKGDAQRAGAAGERYVFRVPAVDWQRTSQRVLTLDWIDGIAISDKARLAAEGHDLRALGQLVMRSFLRHAMRDGFFHADMHQGNLLVDHDNGLVAVDFGIMGRLGPAERRFLAEILHGLITRDYRRAAQVHFDAGYVPAHHSVEVFAQAMRAIGEPIHGRTASEISMADLLGQLFAYTDVFDMETRPELILLQKSMVIVEGVARSLDPDLDMWTAAEPIAREWLEANLGLEGRLRDAEQGAETMGRVVAELPRVLETAERAATAFAGMARDGLRLDAATVEAMATAEARKGRGWQAALWIGALSLSILAVSSLAAVWFGQ